MRQPLFLRLDGHSDDDCYFAEDFAQMLMDLECYSKV